MPKARLSARRCWAWKSSFRQDCNASLRNGVMTSATRAALLAAVAALVGFYYLWQARAGNGPFEWGHDLDGYYNQLAQGFAAGHLYVPAQPSPQLLALPDPWDPKVDGSLRRQDMALYRGHYYLYFGA